MPDGDSNTTSSGRTIEDLIEASSLGTPDAKAARGLISPEYARLVVEASQFRPAIWHEIQRERVRAHLKHGATSMESADPADPTGRRLRILLEELGEVARAFNDAEHDARPVDLQRVRKELIQVAAMAGAWADAIHGGA